MKKFVSSAAVCVFLTNPASSGFAEFCKRPSIKDPKIIEEVKNNGHFGNSERQEKDGFEYDLVSLDFFYENAFAKKKTLASKKDNIRSQVFAKERLLEDRDMRKKFFGKMLESIDMLGIFKEAGDLNEHDEERIKELIEASDPKGVLSEKEKELLLKDIKKDQAKLAKARDNLASESSYTPNTGNTLGTMGVSVGGSALLVKSAAYLAKRYAEKAAVTALLSNPATLAGAAVVATVAGFSTLFFAYKSDTAAKNEVVYQNDVLKTARLGDKIDLLTEKIDSAIKEGKWVGKNAFEYAEPKDLDCNMDPIARFLKIEELDPPDVQSTLPYLAWESCMRKGCVDELKECEDYIQEVDDCIRNKKQIRCSNFFSYKCAKKDNSKKPNENISEDL